MPPELRFIGNVLLFSCIMVFGYGSAFFHWRRFSRYSASAAAVVVRLEEKNSDDTIEITPWVSFQFRGASYEISEFSGPSWVKYREGDRVTVYFDPAKPSGALIGRWRVLIPSLVFGTVGAIALIGLAFDWIHMNQINAD